MKISKEKVVVIHYTLKNKAGEVLDSSEGHPPLAYIQGVGTMIPGLEDALEGKGAGEKFNVMIPPEDAYGKRNENLVKTVPLQKFENPKEVKSGVQFSMETPQGAQTATVMKVENDAVVIDMNHPLADETLYFDLHVLNVREATKEEISHGHVHGPEGHHH